MLLTGGQALVKSLHREGVRVVFGLPGVQMYGVMDAFAEEDGVRFISTRHEQATTYMADGYARAGGQVGTALVVPGPGLLNASAGLGNAYAASSPVLLVAGQINRQFIGRDVGVLHEVRDQLSCIAPITKWRESMPDPTAIPATVRQAFRQLRTGRPRPVAIEMTPEAPTEKADVTLLEPAVDERPAASPGSIREAARVLAGARNVLIWAGGGVNASDASDVLTRVAEYLQAPVCTTNEGKGAISDRHYLSMGVLRRGKDPFKQYLPEFDAVLAVGTRFAQFPVQSGPVVVHIDVDPSEAGRNYKETVPVVGDARRTLEALLPALQELAPPRPSRQAEWEAKKAERWADPFMRTEPVAPFVRALRSAIPDDGIYVPDMTQVGYYSHILYPVYRPRTYLTSSYFGNLGFAFPTALGAKVACPDRAVVSVSGDGGFLFNVQEIATAVQHGIHAVAVVFNDNAYGNVLRDLETNFGRSVGADLKNPDFAAMARSFGARGVRVETPAQLEAALKEALATAAFTLIEVPIQRMVPPAGR